MKKWEEIDSKLLIRNLNRVFKTGNIYNLTPKTYNVLMNVSGFIAHYDIIGFKEHYVDVKDLFEDLRRSSDIANPDYYINDEFFQKDEHSRDYYRSKSETYRGIKELLEQLIK